MKTVVVGLSKRAGAGASAAPAEKTDSRTRIVDRDRTRAACFMWDPLSVGPAPRLWKTARSGGKRFGTSRRRTGRPGCMPAAGDDLGGFRRREARACGGA